MKVQNVSTRYCRSVGLVFFLHDEAWGSLVLFTLKFIAKLCNKHSSMLILMFPGGSETSLASISYAGISEKRMRQITFFFFFKALTFASGLMKCRPFILTYTSNT